MNKQILTGILCLLTAVLMQNPIGAQNAKSTELPDISVIGNFLYQQPEDNEAEFNVREVEFAFQHALYPGVRADIFTALHQEDGETNFELEEAYLTFDNILYTWAPNLPFNPGIGSVIGKKFVEFGKWNAKHPEQWVSADRPLPMQAFLGGSESLAAEGIALNYTVPTPFFLQVQVGQWTVGHGHEEDGIDESHSHEGDVEVMEHKNPISTARIWSSFALSDSQELELGVSTIQGNNRERRSSLQRNVDGADITYTYTRSTYQYLTINAEALRARYADEEGEPAETQDGHTIGAHLRFSKHYDAGIRYDVLEEHGGGSHTIKQTAVYTTRQLTDTMKMRLQYNSSEELENVTTLQFIFGMGPHSHVLQ